MITAWQISSTLDKMEDFIRFVEQFEKQKTQLQSVVPMIQRIKRCQQEKQAINKQLFQLSKTILPINDTDGKQSKEKSMIEKYQRELNKKRKEMQVLAKENTKRLEILSKMTKQKYEKEDKQCEDKRDSLLRELNAFVDEKMKQIELRMENIQSTQKEQGKSLVSTIYEPYISAEIQRRLQVLNGKRQCYNQQSAIQRENQHHSSFQHQKQQLESSIDRNEWSGRQFQRKMRWNGRELGEIKCKLLAFRDNRRRKNIQMLFKGESIDCNKKDKVNVNKSVKDIGRKKVHGDSGQNGLRSMKISKRIKQQQEAITPKQQQPVGLIRSFFSLFTGESHQQKQKIPQPQLFPVGQSHNSSPSIEYFGKKQGQQFVFGFGGMKLAMIKNKEVRLRMTEICAQIVQIREEIDVMVEGNILQRGRQLVGSLIKVNEEIKCYSRELAKVMDVIRHRGYQLSQNRSITSKPQNSVSLQQMRGKKEVQFFLQFIFERLRQRHRLVYSLFVNVRPAIKVAIDYMRKRLEHIDWVWGEFLAEDNVESGGQEYKWMSEWIEKLKGRVDEGIITLKQLELGLKQFQQSYVFYLRQLTRLSIVQDRPYVVDLLDNIIHEQQFSVTEYSYLASPGLLGFKQLISCHEFQGLILLQQQAVEQVLVGEEKTPEQQRFDLRQMRFYQWMARRLATLLQ